MSLLVRRCLSRSHLLEEFVETWQIDHKEAIYARDLDELVSECLELAVLLGRAWRSTVERLFDERERSDRVFASEEVIKGAIRRTVGIFKNVRKLIDEAERKGYSIDASPQFRAAALDVEQLEKETDEQWPPMDSELIRESREAFNQGEYQSAADLLHELQGGGAKAG